MDEQPVEEILEELPAELPPELPYDDTKLVDLLSSMDKRLEIISTPKESVPLDVNNADVIELLVSINDKLAIMTETSLHVYWFLVVTVPLVIIITFGWWFMKQFIL